MLARVWKKKKKTKKAQTPCSRFNFDDPIATDNAFSVQEGQKKEKGLYMYVCMGEAWNRLVKAMRELEPSVAKEVLAMLRSKTFKKNRQGPIF